MINEKTTFALGALGLAGLLALTNLVGNKEIKYFDGQIEGKNITFTEKVDLQRSMLTKLLSYKQTLNVSSTNHETYVFTGRRNVFTERQNGTLHNVKYTGTNGYVQSYSPYSDNVKSLEKMYSDYLIKIDQANK